MITIPGRVTSISGNLRICITKDVNFGTPYFSAEGFTTYLEGGPMEYFILDIIEIAGFKITASSLFREGKEYINHYNIRNKDGEVVSQNYHNLGEPMQLLRQLEDYLLNYSDTTSQAA